MQKMHIFIFYVYQDSQEIVQPPVSHSIVVHSGIFLVVSRTQPVPCVGVGV